MRPGYESVSPYTRRPPIPDRPLPDEESDHRDDVANDVGQTILILSPVFVVMLLFAVATGFFASRTSQQPVATTHLPNPNKSQQ